MAKDSTSIAVLEAFRRQYGASNTFYDRLAQTRIDDLKKQASVAAPPPSPAPLPEIGPLVSPPINKPAPVPKEPEKSGAPITRAEGLKCCIELYFDGQGRKFGPEGSTDYPYSKSMIVEVCNISIQGSNGNKRYTPEELCRLSRQPKAKAARGPAVKQ